MKFAPRYREHEKLAYIKKESEAVARFLEWLTGEAMFIGSYKYVPCLECESEEEQLVRDFSSIEQILARYFKIDLDTLEQEKRQMLKELRKANK